MSNYKTDELDSMFDEIAGSSENSGEGDVASKYFGKEKKPKSKEEIAREKLIEEERKAEILEKERQRADEEKRKREEQERAEQKRKSELDAKRKQEELLAREAEQRQKEAQRRKQEEDERRKKEEEERNRAAYSAPTSETRIGFDTNTVSAIIKIIDLYRAQTDSVKSSIADFFDETEESKIAVKILGETDYTKQALNGLISIYGIPDEKRINRAWLLLSIKPDMLKHMGTLMSRFTGNQIDFNKLKSQPIDYCRALEGIIHDTTLEQRTNLQAIKDLLDSTKK